MAAETKENGEPIERRGLFESCADYLFGFDFFISYAWVDGRQYAIDLQRKLNERGFSCFFDSDDYIKGDNWRVAGKRALKKTSRLILVGTPGAVASEPVENELRIYTDLGRRIFPIDVGGSLSNAEKDEGLFRYLDPDVLRVNEDPDALAEGPTPEVLQEIFGSFDMLRQDQKRTRWLAGLSAVFAAVAAVAVLFFFNARSKKKEAEHQTAIAENQTAEATRQEKKAKQQKRKADRQRSVAETQREEAEKEKDRAEENLAQSNLNLAGIAIGKERTNEALLRLWQAYDHAPNGSPQRKSALRLIGAWTPYASRTIHSNVQGEAFYISPDGKRALVRTAEDEATVILIEIATGTNKSINSDFGQKAEFSISPNGEFLAFRTKSSEQKSNEITVYDLVNIDKSKGISILSKSIDVDPSHLFAIQDENELYTAPPSRIEVKRRDMRTGSVVQVYRSGGSGLLSNNTQLICNTSGPMLITSENGQTNAWGVQSGILVALKNEEKKLKLLPLNRVTTTLDSEKHLESKGSTSRHIFAGQNQSRFVSADDNELEIGYIKTEPKYSLSPLQRLKHQEEIRATSFSSDGKMVHSVDNTTAYYSWSVFDKARPKPQILTQSSNDYDIIRYLLFDHYILEQSSNNIAIRDLNLPLLIPRILQVKLGPVVRFAISPGEDRVVIASKIPIAPPAAVASEIESGSDSNFELSILSLNPGETGNLPKIKLKDQPTHMSFNATGSSVFATFDKNPSLYGWDCNSGKELEIPENKKLELPKSKPPFEDHSFLFSSTPSNSHFALAFGNNVIIWDTSKLAPQLQSEFTIGENSSIGDNRSIAGISISSDGNLVAVASHSSQSRMENTGEVRVFRSGKFLSGPIKAVSEKIELAFSPDGSMLAIASGKKLRTFRVETGRLELQFPRFEGELTGFSYAHEGNILASASQSIHSNDERTEIRIWDAMTGIALSPPLSQPIETDCFNSISFRDNRFRLVPIEGNIFYEINHTLHSLRDDREEIKQTLELLTGYSFLLDGDRTPLSRAAEKQRLKSFRSDGPPLGLPVLAIVETGNNEDELKETILVGPLSSEEAFVSFLTNWIAAGNSEKQAPRRQEEFFTDPALIEEKQVSNSMIAVEQEEFKEKYPKRVFTYIGHKILSSEGDVKTVIVTQHVFLTDREGKERELEIQDQLRIREVAGTPQIVELRRVDTKVLRSSSLPEPETP